MARMRHSTFFVVLGIAIVSSWSVALANESPGETTPLEESPTASNQSITLDPVETVSAVTEDQAEPKAESQDAVRDHRRTTAKHPLSRGTRFAKRTSGAGSLLEIENPPWYRTGIGALGIVLGTIGVAVWVVRRWMPSVRTADAGVLRIVGRANISPKHSVTLVQLGRRFVMVGVSGDGLSQLCEVTDPDEVAELAARVGSPGGSSSDAFEQVFMSEASGFSDVRKGKAQATESVRESGEPESRSLTGLLRRLQTLQRS